MSSGNEAAFAQPKYVNIFPESDHAGEIYCSAGLSKREWFAGLALQGIVIESQGLHPIICAKRACEQADALLAELAKETK